MTTKQASTQGPVWQLWAGVLAGPLFITVFLIEGATRGGGYDALRHPVSSLSIGELGWIQQLNFLVLGLLLLAFATGLLHLFKKPGGSKWGPLLVGLVAVGFIGAGTFITDPLSGYPLGTMAVPAVKSLPSVLHELFSFCFFIGFPIACIVLARMFGRLKNRAWKIYTALSGGGMFLFFVLAAMGFGQVAGFVEWGGLLQRTSIIISLTYLSFLALYAIKIRHEKTSSRLA